MDIITPSVPFSVMATNTTSSVLDTDLNFQSVVLTMTSLLMSLFITCVNVLTIVVIRRTSFLRTLSNMYVTSLATSDLVVGLCLIPLSLFYIPSLRSQLFDHNIRFCAFIFGMNLGVAIVSSITMTLIATDRYLYILRPYTYERVVTKQFVLLLVILTWVFGVFYGLLPQLIHNDPAKVTRCDVTLVMPVGYLFYANLTIYSILVIVDFSLYSQILYTAHRQRRIIDAAAPVVSEVTSRPAVTRTSQCLTSDTLLSCDHPANRSAHTHAPRIDSENVDELNSLSTRAATPSVVTTTALRDFYKTNVQFLTAAVMDVSEIEARNVENADKINGEENNVIKAAPRDYLNVVNGHEIPVVLQDKISGGESKVLSTVLQDKISGVESKILPTVLQDKVSGVENKVLPTVLQDKISGVTSKNISTAPRKKGNLRLRGMKFFLTVFGVYFLCLTPTVVCMGVDYYRHVPRFLYNTFNLLALMNSGVNFIIYLLLNVKFKVAVMRFLRISKSTTFNDITDMSNWDI